MFNLMFTFFFFVGITYTSDDVICVQDSNIDPEIVKSITWLPLVGVLQGVEKIWTPFFPILPLRPFFQYFLKFLTKQIQSRSFSVRWEFTVTVNNSLKGVNWTGWGVYLFSMPCIF